MRIPLHSSRATDLYIGLMSGTSVDGVDCALVRFGEGEGEGEGERPRVLAAATSPIDPVLRGRILDLSGGGEGGAAGGAAFSSGAAYLEAYGEVDIAVGRLFAEAVQGILKEAGISAAEVRAIGSHGQTVYHRPPRSAEGSRQAEGSYSAEDSRQAEGSPFTLQLGDPNTIAHLTGITTVADFRRRDMAAGGEGAPLAPLLHRHLFAAAGENRAVLNLGGIANVTLLQAGGACLAFDVGPANILMDYWAQKHLGADYDQGGEWAASGTVHRQLLQALLDEPYFRRPPPKSTGRELFNGAWLEGKLAAVDNASPEAADVQATLLELTAVSMAEKQSGDVAALYVCGGGAHNEALMKRLQALLPGAKVASTAELGLEPDWVEATAFAWMARETLADRPLDTGPFTGAQGPLPLGGVYYG